MNDAQWIELADGRRVPQSAVAALEQLDQEWPGATLPQARPAIAAAILSESFCLNHPGATGIVQRGSGLLQCHGDHD